MTESIPVVIDAAGPPGTSEPSEERAVHCPCPVCGSGTRHLDRFCRQCGINLGRWETATTGSLYETSTLTP
jgi:hypothetical protein